MDWWVGWGWGALCWWAGCWPQGWRGWLAGWPAWGRGPRRLPSPRLPSPHQPSTAAATATDAATTTTAAAFLRRWAVGVLIYEMVAGYPPFYQEDRVAMFRAICSTDFKMPTHFSKVAVVVVVVVVVVWVVAAGQLWGRQERVVAWCG